MSLSTMTRSRALLVVGILAILTASALATLAVARIASTQVLAGKIDSPWRTHLQSMNRALAEENVSGAVMAWHDAYGAAFGSREWDAMVAVGDASLRIGETAGMRSGFEARARRSYLSALFRARQQGSLEGVLRSTEAFAGLGDRDVVEQGVQIAYKLVAHNPVRGLSRASVPVNR